MNVKVETMLCYNCQSPTGVGFKSPLSYENMASMPSQNATVEDLEKEMSLVETMVKKLNVRRALLQRRINALSPIARLPAEVLTEIFRTTCQLYDHSDRAITPLFFGGICKEWRQITWYTPLLWNNLSLHVSNKTHGSQVNLLGEWLLRAGTAPLFIKLTSDDEHESIFCSLRAIMDVLVTRAAYWRALDCLLPPQCHDVLKNHEFPMLSSVSLRPPKGTISTFSEPPSMFLAAPKLIDVDLSGYNFPSMVLPWEQLLRFKTQFLTVAECLKVLRRSPNLKRCHLESVYSPEIFSTTPPELLYSELDDLDISLIKGAAISLLDGLALPHLRALSIHYCGPGGFLLSAVSSLVSRSSCDLQRLCIEKQNIQDDDLIPCLEYMPSLEYLRLVSQGTNSHPSVGLTDRLVAKLRPAEDGGSSFLPKIRSFEYRGNVPCSSHSLVEVLVERWNMTSASDDESDVPHSRLAVVNISASAAYEIAEGDREELAKLRDGGMQVEVQSIWTKL